MLIRPSREQVRAAQLRARHDEPRHRAPVVRRRMPGVPRVAGGTVPALLVVAAAVAAMSGLFSPSSPVRAVASTSMSQTKETLPKLPAGSGHGLRVVFDQSEQRVWLVASDGDVKRTYLVTGSRYDNLRPGSYLVNSRSRVARTYGGGGTFEYFVKFAQGRTSAIGFHAITKLNDGRLVYAREDLGTAHTPGCVEAMRDDAVALWEFAPVGTPVVVTA